MGKRSQKLCANGHAFTAENTYWANWKARGNRKAGRFRRCKQCHNEAMKDYRVYKYRGDSHAAEKRRKKEVNAAMITDQEKRLARKIRGPSQMERVVAARCFINQATRCSQERVEDLELHAFMAIFHPEVSTDKVRQMSRDRKSR